MKTRSTFVVLMFLFAIDCHAQAADIAFRRWAVIASPEVRALGVSDLLTAELTQREFDLVEREQLDAISKEIELTQLLGANTKERLNVGLRLKADALVLLSIVNYEDVRSLKVVISECRQGARLRLEILPVSVERNDGGATRSTQPLTAALTKGSPGVMDKAARPDELARHCATIMGETRGQFASGVRQLFTVSPLHSKNLTRDFDYLQVGYSALLGRAISQMPGTALVEIDEARAIRQELATVGEAEVAGRPAPMFIEGEFAMQGRDEATRVRIKLRLTDGKADQRTLESTDLTQDQAVDWLFADVPREVVATQEGTPDRRPFTRREQFEKLAKRAELFSLSASLEEAASLREAALLLIDNDVEQRFWLLADLRRRQREHTLQSDELRRSVYLKDPKKYRSIEAVCLTEDEYRPRFEEARQRWWRAVDLASWLLLRQVLSRREAAVVFVALAGDAHYLMSFLEPNQRADIQKVAEQLPWTMVERYWQLDYTLRPLSGRSALQRAGFSVIGNTGDEKHDHDTWCQQLFQYWLTSRTGSTLSEVQKLSSWTRFVAEHTSQKMFSQQLFLGMSFYRDLRNTNRFTAEQLQASCDQLDQTGAELIQAYARCGRLAIRMAEPIGTWDDAMRQEAAAVRKIFLSRGVWEGALYSLNEIEEKVRSKSSKKDALSTNTPLAANSNSKPDVPVFLPFNDNHPLSTNTLLGTDPNPKIAFEPLPMVRATWQKLRRVNAGLDVMWSTTSVWTMSQAGIVKQIFKSYNNDDVVLDVCFDERCLWVFAQESGLHVYSHAGELLCTTLPSDAPERDKTKNIEPSLPPVGVDAINRRVWPLSQYVYSRYLHSLGPGRCLAMGTYVPKGRLWFADVSMNEQSSPPPRLSVKVVHECTTDPQESPRGNDDDPTESFKPRWMTEIQTSTTPARRLLLIDRSVFFASNFKRCPLAVDLETLKVSVYPGRIGVNVPDYGGPHYFHSGNILIPGGGIHLLTPPRNNSQHDWEHIELFRITVEIQRKKMWWLSPSREFVAIGDHIECPGQTWRRVFPSEGRIVQVAPERISPRYRFEHYGMSAHYGMVAWNVGDMLHRVHFDHTPERGLELAWRYPFLPESIREKHDQAIQAIRSLGGQVDSVWPRVTLPEVKDRDWSTHVFLADTWRGGDAGLQHLANLNDLRELRIVKANITDEGCKTIGAITTLRRLNFEETQVTDAGLLTLTELKNLIQLRLECQIDKPLFTDVGLKIIHHLPKLNALAFSGPGFTEAALETIVSRPVGTALLVRPFDTNIPAAKFEQFRSQKRGFTYEFWLNLADQGVGW